MDRRKLEFLMLLIRMKLGLRKILARQPRQPGQNRRLSGLKFGKDIGFFYEQPSRRVVTRAEAYQALDCIECRMPMDMVELEEHHKACKDRMCKN